MESIFIATHFFYSPYLLSINYYRNVTFNPESPLAIAFYYNANINRVVTVQLKGPEMKTLPEMFVKFSKKLRTLCKKWCESYSYIDKQKCYLLLQRDCSWKGICRWRIGDFAEIVYNVLINNGRTVQMVFPGKTWYHKLKHQYIDDSPTAKKYLLPGFTRQNN